MQRRLTQVLCNIGVGARADLFIFIEQPGKGWTSAINIYAAQSPARYPSYMSSNKHHYLPEFYLKGFVNPSGQFAIFDYQKGHIKKGEYFPSTHFFQPHRNTIKFEGRRSDFPEQSYSVKDNRFSKLFQVIQSSQGLPHLDTMQMLTLQEFVTNIFWRIPQNDELFRQEFENNPLFTKSLKFKDNFSIDQKSFTYKNV